MLHCTVIIQFDKDFTLWATVIHLIVRLYIFFVFYSQII